MVKYSSSILIASIWLFTVSCLAVASDSGTPSESKKFEEEILTGYTNVATDLTDISASSNVFVRMIRDMADIMIEKYDKDKKQIKRAVKKGIEMEKKIQSLSQSLKNSTIPLTKVLQAEVDAIGKHATSKLTKLKGMENDKDIEGIEKEAKAKYTEIKGKIQDLFKAAITVPKKASVTTTSGAQNTEEFKKTLLDLKTKLFAIFSASVPVALSAQKNEDTVSKKMKTTYITLSEIHSDLDRVEQIQYNLLRSCKTHSGTDAASLIHSSLALYVFAILIGMLF